MTPSTRTRAICDKAAPDEKTAARVRRPLSGFPRLLLLEAALDPVGALHAFGRIHDLRGVALDVDERELAVHELRLAVRGLHDRLVALADRHAHRAAGSLEGRAFQGLA